MLIIRGHIPVVENCDEIMKGNTEFQTLRNTRKAFVVLEI